jgi:hypothetical protein
MKELLKIDMVKTDNGCFITDCKAVSGYDWQYHRTKIDKIFFDGAYPSKTFSPNWLRISNYPTKIQELKQLPSINRRYELKDKNFASDKLPEVIKCEDRDNYDEDVFVLYNYKEDRQKPILIDVKCEINIVMEIENFSEPPVINYKAIKRDGWSDGEFQITNLSLDHQLFDKMIFPSIMLHSRPCSISSQNLYALVRQHIKDNIDNKFAKITSDYDFCFTVKKLVSLIEPENVSYHNLFARTKKERNKIHYAVNKFKEVQIFEMTHAQKRYENYTVIESIYADNEAELKNKIDEFLKNLMEIINKPLTMCLHCNGTGYTDEVKKINQEDLMK